MIKHHPTAEILKDFATGELPDSLSLIVSSHVEMCEQCQAEVTRLTELAASDSFGSDEIIADELIENQVNAVLHGNDDINSAEFDMSLIDSITADEQLDVVVASEERSPQRIKVADTEFELPRALNQVVRKDWLNLGKISRARLDFEDGDHHTSLLHIDKEGAVPCHTHKGFEITLLLEGSFEDEMGEYHKGDFIWLDGEHTHQPFTKEGCVCLTVSSDALYFTKGVSQLFNPIGKFIY